MSTFQFRLSITDMTQENADHFQKWLIDYLVDRGMEPDNMILSVVEIAEDADDGQNPDA